MEAASLALLDNDAQVRRGWAVAGPLGGFGAALSTNLIPGTIQIHAGHLPNHHAGRIWAIDGHRHVWKSGNVSQNSTQFNCRL